MRPNAAAATDGGAKPQNQKNSSPFYHDSPFDLLTFKTPCEPQGGSRASPACRSPNPMATSVSEW
jgi:hypothetical protein